MSGPLSRVTRRSALRWGAGAAALGGAALTACGPATGRSVPAAPAVQSPTTELLFNANVQGVSWNKTVRGLYQQFVDQNFNADPANKGLRATVTADNGQGASSAQIAASIAGSGYPDIVNGCCTDFSTYFSGGWLLPLDKYIRQDNLQTNVWSKRYLEALAVNGQQVGMPCYDATVCVVYRQDLLDALGLPYPDANWTWQQALDLWTRCTGKDAKTGKQRSGVSFMFSSGDYWQKLNFWLHGWGALEVDEHLTTCLADSAKAVQCLTFMAEAAKNKVAIPRAEVGALTGGQAVFSMCGVWTVFPQAQQLGTKYKWNILPAPIWPEGRSTYDGIQFYGINRVCPHPDQAWQLMKWLTYQPDWQRFQIKTTLVSPCLMSLWEEWETSVKAVAPPLADKDLHWYADASQNAYAWPAAFFRYAMPQVISAINDWIDQIWNGRVSPELGLQQMARQINALQAVGPRLEQAQKIQAQLFPTQGPPIAAVPSGI